MCHDCLAAGYIGIVVYSVVYIYIYIDIVVYSVPKKHPLAQVNLLNFGFRTVIEI